MDPNGVVGTPRDIWVWLAPDWSDYREGETKPQNATGWTRVKIRETLYNDGRIVRNVLDANGNPVAEGGAPASGAAPAKPLDSTPQYDEEQAKRWKEQQTAAKPQPVSAPPTQPTIVTRDPATGALTTQPNPNYVPPTGAAQKPTGGREVTEGTPDPSKPGGYDNERPRKVIRDASGKEVWSEELTGTELTAWREARERSRNPDGKTDAQIAADKEKADAAARLARGETRADSAEARAAAAANQPDVRVETVTKNGQTYTRQITTPKGGGAPTIRTFGPDGKELPGGIPGETQIQNAPPFTPDWNKPGLGIIEYASTVRARPDLTDEQKAKLIQEAHTLATATVSQGNAVLSAQQTEASRQTTERGQDAGMANQRLSSSSSNFGTAVKQAADDTKYSLGSEAASVLPYYLALGQASGQAYGGFNTPPAVRPGAAIGQMQGQTIPGLATMLPGSFKPGAPATPPPVAGADQAAAGLPPPIFSPQPVAPPPSGAPPTAGEPGGPPLAPGPVAPTPQAAAPGPVPVPSTGAPYTPEAASASVFTPAPPPQPSAPNEGGQYAPQMASPGVGATGDGSPVYSPLPHEMQPPVNANPQAPLPWMPQGMQQGGGGLSAMLGNVGPWAGQPQQQPGQPTGLGALMMQRAGGYQPYSLNQSLLEAGIDPEVIQMMGGVG